MLKKINGYSDTHIRDINNWLETENNEGYIPITDDKVITLCTIAENKNIYKTIIINNDQPKVISHNNATSHLEQLMVYFEHQEMTTLNELLMLKWMRDHAVHKRYTKLAQQKITDFI